MKWITAKRLGVRHQIHLTTSLPKGSGALVTSETSIDSITTIAFKKGIRRMFWTIAMHSIPRMFLINVWLLSRVWRVALVDEL